MDRYLKPGDTFPLKASELRIGAVFHLTLEEAFGLEAERLRKEPTLPAKTMYVTKINFETKTITLDSEPPKQ